MDRWTLVAILKAQKRLEENIANPGH
jgi:hypothetical protein